DLSVGERAHLLTINGNRADQLFLLQQRDDQQRASPGEIGKSDNSFVPFKVMWPGSNIVDMRNLFGFGDIGQTTLRMRPYGLAFACGELRRRIVQGDSLVGLTVIEAQSTETRLANPRGVFQNSVEHRPQLARR